MKYTVLIADDERIIREGIAGEIPWEELSLVLLGKAADGKEGFDFIRKNQTDIAIIDIKMPRMNGFELIAKAHEEKISTEFIVLSGYDDFEYAQKAMQYGVKYFLLKPSEPEEIIEALKGTVEQIRKKREMELVLNRYEENSKKLKTLMKEQFLRDCILGRAYSPEEKTYYLSLLGMEGKESSVVAVRADSGGDGNRIFLVRTICEEHLGEKLFLSAIIHDMVYFVTDRMKKEELFSLAEELIGALKSSGFSQVTATFAEKWDIQDPVSVSNDLEACIRFRFWIPEAEIITREDIDFSENVKAVFAFDTQSLLNCLRCGDFEAASFELNMFFDALSLQKSSIEIAKFNVIRLYLEMLELLGENMEGYMSDTAAIQSKGTLAELYDFILEFAREVSEKIKLQHEKKNNKKIDSMLKCIEENIANEEFSLKWLSNNLLYFNTDYLGKLFKKEMGISFTNYVIKRRIEIACELFKSNPEYRVYDVAEKTGFGGNTQYFSQVFKKVTGILPSDFLKTL